MHGMFRKLAPKTRAKAAVARLADPQPVAAWPPQKTAALPAQSPAEPFLLRPSMAVGQTTVDRTTATERRPASATPPRQADAAPAGSEASDADTGHRSPRVHDALPLAELIRRYDYMEDLCDRVIAEQQTAQARHHQRVSEDHLRQAMRGTGEICSHPPADMAGLAEVEELETEIRIYRYQLETLESVIYETEPRSLPEALAKLRFISRLVVEGVQIEADFFAFLIEECADMAEIGMSDMLAAERRKLRPEGERV